MTVIFLSNRPNIVSYAIDRYQRMPEANSAEGKVNPLNRGLRDALLFFGYDRQYPEFTRR